MSRASSYDPFSTRSNVSSSMTSSYSRPSYYSNLTSMSHSYHPDYTSRSLSKRFGSSDQLNSSTYKSPYSSSNFSKYRPPEGNRERSSYRASSTFSPRTPLPSSDSRRERDFSSSSRDFPSISLSKYRPDSSSYGFSTNSYSRPASSYTASSSSASTYKPRVRIEYRSKTPGVSNSSTSEARLSRYDRDVRSLCPIEKSYVGEDEKSVDDVEKTFRKLYNRYVKDINERTDEDYAKISTKSTSVDKLTSKNEAPMIQSSIADIETEQEAELKTPRASPVDVTPKASPKLKKKEISDMKSVPTVIPTRKLKPAASAMDKLLRKDSLTIKLTDAIDKKKTTPESTSKVFPTPSRAEVDVEFKNDITINSKPSSELSKPTTNLVANLSSPKETALKVPTKLSKSLSPAPTQLPAQLTSKSRTEMKLPPPSSANTSSSPSKTSSSTSISSSITSSLLLNSSETAPGKSSSEDSEVSRKPTKPSTTKIGCQQTIKKKPDLTINLNSAEEPSSELTFFSSKSIRSRSSSPITKTERSKSNLTVNGPKVKEMRRSASPSTTNSLEVEREERAHSEDTNKATKKKRDLTRTLENLKEKLEDEQRKQKDEVLPKVKNMEVEPKQAVRPPLLLLTQPSMPSTPLSTTGTILWNSDPNIEYTDEEWTEEDEADYESDSEFTISQTFKIPDRLPIGDLYPLQSPDSSRCSPFASDYDSDSSPPFLAVNNESADYRGRVGQKFAVPPPTFTCSVSYDGQEAWDSEEDGSVHSCQDFDDIYTGRPTSSGLAYLTPSDEDEEESIYDEESVAVGCTLKLVDRAARRDDGDYTDDSEYYDDEEFTDEEYWDEDEEYEEEFEYSDEEEADLSECENTEMHSICDSPELIPISADLQEEAFEFEEADAEFEMDATFLHASPKEVTPDVTGADKHREVTYTKDMTVLTKVEEASNLNIGDDKLTKAKAKRITKDGRTEKADKNLISSCVIPAEEIVSEATFTELASDTMMEASLREHEETIGLMEVNVIPTFVKSQTEKVQEESTSRFSDRKPSTDFARKAVIQPNKLETAKVQKVETKIGERPKAAVDNKTQSMKQASKAKEVVTKTKLSEVQPGTSKERSTIEAAAADKLKNIKEVEDKSNLRKSALNMNQEEAKRKAKADEEAAKIKARRFGTVSALMDKFKEDPKPAEPITYKRSSRLAAKETEERPRRKYEIVKPVINDEFDKQMEEIRAQMKAGSSQLQDQMKNLSKGISTTAEEVKKRELEEKHKHLLNKASGVFSEADKEKMRWKERRDAETEAELAKIESSKGARVSKQEVVQKALEGTEKKEPKRTVRKIVRDKSPAGMEITEIEPQRSTNAIGESSLSTKQVPIRNMAVKPPLNNTANKKSCESTTEKPEQHPPAVPKDIFRREKTPVVKPADTIKKPVAPKQNFIVDESNFDLLQAATQVATRRRKSLVELKQQKEKTSEQKAVNPSKSKTDGAMSPKLGPKGEGAAATKIRNTLGNVVNVQADSKSPAGSEKSSSSRRYGARRKTQEIVNESQQPKRKRKEQRRKNKFIGDPHDIDILFGWDKENSFEKMEKMFQTATSDRMNTSCTSGKKRRTATKIWISDLTDIDKIYKPSEIRDITASVDM
ncbi:unnamed protein product [Auanema sp. JU1783]|nr:unnamed protein product [Auanema sp. JU1783]